MISSIPIRLVHVIYPLCINLLYAVFTFVFWTSGAPGPSGKGTIYEQINWSRPIMAIVACQLVIILSLLIHVRSGWY
ncbi:unnamed protein product [Protopolystoma xenopodis]|uniref:Uncharacterized protein n=1 Tax=Protopolystoma xenopodis TaxID=117903 RepID=A0A3S4ZAW0_9PLAT|nr:unnamed protein product [Protopolystoma xenopodis]